MRREKPNEWISIADLMAGVVGVVILFFLMMALLAHKAVSASVGEADSARTARTKIIGDLETMLDRPADAELIRLFKEKGVVLIPSDEMFKLGQTNLTTEGLATTTGLLAKLAAILPCYSNSGVRCSNTTPMRWPCHSGQQCVDAVPIFETVLIEGHADASAATPDCDNWCLSTARAKAVFAVAKARYRPLMDLKNSDGQPLFGLAGYGESRPIIGGHYRPTDGIQRRIELRFILAAPSAAR